MEHTDDILMLRCPLCGQRGVAEAMAKRFEVATENDGVFFLMKRGLDGKFGPQNVSVTLGEISARGRAGHGGFVERAYRALCRFAKELKRSGVDG